MQHLPLAWLIDAKLRDLGRAKKFLTKSGGGPQRIFFTLPLPKKMQVPKAHTFLCQNILGKNTFFNQLFLKVEFDTKDQVLFYFK